MHHLADDLVAVLALALATAELQLLPLGLVRRLDNLADMTGAFFTRHVGAVVVEKISHCTACSDRVGERVDGNLAQKPADVARHNLVEAGLLVHHGDELAVLETA